MTRKVLLYLIGAFAIVLIALGLSWNALFPPQSYWSPEQAREYQDAFRHAHTVQDAVDHGKLVANGADLQAARERYQRIQDQLSSARNARGRTGKILICGGLIMLLGNFLLRHFWAAPASENNR